MSVAAIHLPPRQFRCSSRASREGGHIYFNHTKLSNPPFVYTSVLVRLVIWYIEWSLGTPYGRRCAMREGLDTRPGKPRVLNDCYLAVRSGGVPILCLILCTLMRHRLEQCIFVYVYLMLHICIWRCLVLLLYKLRWLRFAHAPIWSLLSVTLLHAEMKHRAETRALLRWLAWLETGRG